MAQEFSESQAKVAELRKLIEEGKKLRTSDSVQFDLFLIQAEYVTEMMAVQNQMEKSLRELYEDNTPLHQLFKESSGVQNTRRSRKEKREARKTRKEDKKRERLAKLKAKTRIRQEMTMWDSEIEMDDDKDT